MTWALEDLQGLETHYASGEVPFDPRVFEAAESLSTRVSDLVFETAEKAQAVEWEDSASRWFSQIEQNVLRLQEQKAYRLCARTLG